MKLVVNEPLIKQRKTLAQVLTFASLAVLGVGLFFAFQKDITKMYYSYIALILGFILSQVGMYFTTRFGRSPRFDEVVTHVIEKLRHEYSFYVYNSPTSMLLVGPSRIWLPIPLTASGEVSYENGKWKQKGGNALMKFMGQEGIGKPDKDFAMEERNLRAFMAYKGIPLEEQPEIKPVLISMMKTSKIGNVADAPLPVVELEELKRYIRRIDREEAANPISPEMFEKINQIFDNYKSSDKPKK
ncbi:MAG: hypothetical protein VB108_00795 [Anaerolineaceae bacterium]|nr:hypothetical protein [Anaerolineaceae bacterium]